MARNPRYESATSAAQALQGRNPRGNAAGEGEDMKFYGPLNNEVVYQQLNDTANDLDKLIVASIGYGIFNHHFNDERVPKAVSMLIEGRHLGKIPRLTPDERQIKTEIELIAVAVPEAKRMEQAEARQEVIRAVTAILNHIRSGNPAPMRSGIIDVDLITGWIVTDEGIIPRNDAQLAEDRANPLQARPGLLCIPADRDLTTHPISFDTAMTLLTIMADRCPLNLNAIDIVAEGIVALAKQGSITPRLLQKIENNVNEECNLKVALDRDRIQSLYSWEKKNITPASVQRVVEHLLQILPANCMTLRNLLSRMGGAGLTAYKTIGKAMNLFRDFQWNIINGMFPGEIENFLRAVELVNDNQYFGYSPDLGAAKSTNFKYLAFTAKELLIRHGQGTELARYLGWAATTPHRQQLDDLLNNYVGGGNVAPIDLPNMDRVFGTNFD